VLLRRLAHALLIKTPQAHGVAACAAVVAEITITEAARHQVITVVALMAQVAIRTVSHRQLSISPNAAAGSGSMVWTWVVSVGLYVCIKLSTVLILASKVPPTAQILEYGLQEWT
jgi:hypothetical protein